MGWNISGLESWVSGDGSIVTRFLGRRFTAIFEVAPNDAVPVAEVERRGRANADGMAPQPRTC